MPHKIRVEPVADGWAVRHNEIENAQIFASGAKAESAARRLGARLASAGDRAVVEIFLRDGSLAGRITCGAAA